MMYTTFAAHLPAVGCLATCQGGNGEGRLASGVLVDSLGGKGKAMGRQCVPFLLRGGVLALAIVVFQGHWSLGQGKDNRADRPADAESKSRRTAPLGTRSGAPLSERAVAAALNWLARHQSRDGSWALDGFRKQCKDASCTGPGSVPSAAAGTALALLPFLGAGQTHETKGPYRKTVYDGLFWIMKNQKRNGDLSVDVHSG